MRRPTDTRRMYPPGIPTKRDAWSRFGNWILAVIAVAAYFVIVHFANS